MSAESERYVLDANAFIQAKRRFYGFAFCPGYWRALKWHQQQGRLCSIDRVRDELVRGGDDLADWVQQEFGEAAFADASTGAVSGTYAQMLAWVMAQPQFLDPAKAEFQQVADGWLAAYAKVHRCRVVTLEEFDPVIKKKVPLPNVCRAFDVETITPFEMLRRLNVRLSWRPPA
jgi:predicted nucleic acid-binding protein